MGVDAGQPVAAEPQAPPRAQVWAWGLWDWGSAAFNAVIITFIFSVYVTSVDAVGGNVSRPGTWYAWSLALAGLFIALLAPVTGQRADAGGHRKRSLGIWTYLVVAIMFALFLVRDDGAGYFWLALALLGAASVFASFAEVSYFAMLRQVSTPATVGRVSGFGWAMGYFGGIVLLVISYFGFIAGEDGSATKGFLGISAEAGLNVRLVAVLAAAWFAIFALPVLLKVPEVPRQAAGRRVGFFASYRVLFKDLAGLWRTDRNAVYFLLASALFRDGLAAIFTLGAVLANTVYGISTADVLIFGIAANVVSAVGALVGGRLDDKIGAKGVIVVSLIGLVVTALVLLMVSGQLMFWIFGLILVLFVGPAQSAARTYLTRIAAVGREGQMFGLYTTTGRAVSFLAPGLFALFSGVFGNDRWGIIGIVLVLGAGLAAMVPVAQAVDKSTAPAGASAGTAGKSGDASGAAG
ncbi:MFS transporter [Nakamurella aerolata]|uniref:MFS transporter n=1 Tax=Nakamurella aerolata TaxID=1656892 RepID=A0A849ALC3_9ACTN|nr:MFS transporter [Nakamurella aerolata]NNG37612.1 MFS transporter [Nakamurella aerolata]